ncbi:LodA/GoxA family CTQ-dependent oxidase [Sphingomonas sp. ERG5]|uniref:LodA/GoxA family CTQ-dependent oxidase n=1 Tax=Sphingomonas sp. ERG5 TaxID=1381597 RepID=UPI00054C2679|nr:LodA/GoxA family CTQ-dependent oxidase [Sphingomonas sp. ERG5]
MASPPVYRIHPAIGIARLGDSPDGFCITPEGPAQLPIECDSMGNPAKGNAPVKKFKDGKGRIKRQAARFQIYVYDEQSPEGRPLKLKDGIEGGGNQGTLVDIQWRVQLANKKAAWYTFDGLRGEVGYPSDAPLRNPTITDAQARQKLIIDPGPQTVDHKTRRKASFARDTNPAYAVNFPPTGMQPRDIDTLGDLITDDDGRLLVLAGHGRSGSFASGFGHPRIDTYANSDSWFDDISDGPVMARLVMQAENVGQLRYIDVEYPAWVLAGYPRYAPEVLDMITLEDVVEDLSIREFAYRPDMYGTASTFENPQPVDPLDTPALLHWKAGPVQWNPDYRPWFWRDIWPIIFRADEFSYFAAILQLSNFPHNQSSRGTFDPYRLCIPPKLAPRTLAKKLVIAADDHRSGKLLEAALEPSLMLLDATQAPGAASATDLASGPLKAAAAVFAATVCPPVKGETPEAYAARWRLIQAENEAEPSAVYAEAHAAWGVAVDAAIAAVAAAVEPTDKPLLKLARASTRQEPGEPDRTQNPDEPIDSVLRRLAFEYRAGILLTRALDQARLDATTDPGRAARQYLFDLLRKPGEENSFRLGSNPATRTYHLPLMPLLAGDNPITNKTVSKFLRLTDTQLFMLRQWARGLFIDEVAAGFVPDTIDPWQPYKGWTAKTGRELDRGVLSNALGGAFCPGGEVTWVIRNPAIWHAPYRIKADPEWYQFQLTAAQQNANRWGSGVSEEGYVAYISDPLSQGSDFDVGLQPGDMTKLSGLPWQADFNECTTQMIDVTYEAWNQLSPDSIGDSLMTQEQRVWETLWWPAHRPMQVFYPTMVDGKATLQFRNWARGIPQTLAGDLKMVTEWSKLGFVVRNPKVAPGPSPDSKYICVEDSGD